MAEEEVFDASLLKKKKKQKKAFDLEASLQTESGPSSETNLTTEKAGAVEELAAELEDVDLEHGVFR